MEPPHALPDELTGDPIVARLLSGQADTLNEAEEQYLNDCLPEVAELLRAGLTDEELARHPLIRLVLTHGSRGWEDSLL